MSEEIEILKEILDELKAQTKLLHDMENWLDEIASKD